MSIERVDRFGIQRGQTTASSAIMYGYICCSFCWTVILCIIPLTYTYQFEPAVLNRDALKTHYLKEYMNGTNMMYFRHLVVSKDSETLYVGAMNHIYRLNISDISQNYTYKYLNASWDSYRKCTVQGKTAVFECHNHIRVIQELEDGKLFVCGTGGYSPTKYELSVNLSSTTDTEERGIAMCPYDPYDNATSIYITQGNPMNVSSMYFGTYTDFIKNYPIFFRPVLNAENGTKLFSEKVTDKYDKKWLSAPQFVGTFDVGEELFIFFRETAEEYLDSDNKLYSRVAKVCKDDTGNDLTKKWLSFQKARLICKMPGDFYFDDIYDVWSDGGENFYALFHKQGGPYGSTSGICQYTKTSITASFNGKYKYKPADTIKWTTVPDANDPNPRPGNCTLHRTTPSVFADAMPSYQLMDTDVAPKFGKPIYAQSGVHLLRFVGDTVKNVDGERIATLLYAASADGKVYVISQTSDQENETKVPVIYDLSSGDSKPAIWDIECVNRSLYLGTDQSVIQLNASICLEMKKADTCVYTGYCKWDGCSNLCVHENSFVDCDDDKVIHLDEVRDTEPTESTATSKTLYKHLVDGQIINMDQPVTVNASLGLYVTLHLDSPLSVSIDQLNWSWNETDNGSWTSISACKIQPQTQQKYLVTPDGDLLIQGVQSDDLGYYKVNFGTYDLKKFHVQALGSTNANLIEAWKQEFVDWSRHFKRWKACSQPYFDSCPSQSCQP